ncbi:M6 family metalloprotease domain-containing protein [Streptomyces sp. NPDC049577]|uniref:M6 family metalloprotease domain-containing protein n=1 Tax=Streptomyces sp. NPDC049577 TaxID=3155153 RepID=UPI003435A406
MAPKRPLALTALTTLTATALALTAPPFSRAVPEAPPARPGAPAGRHPSGPCALHPRTDHVSESTRTPHGFSRSAGTVRALTLFIDFPDAPARITPQQRYAEFFPAVADYYRASSYGRLDYRSTPVPRWIRMARPYAAYRITRGSAFDPRRDDGYHALSREILAALGRTVDPGRFDLVNVLAAPDAGPPATEDVRSVTFAGAGTPLKNVSFIWSRQTGDSPYRVLAHENAHSFGLPDLYYASGRTDDGPVGHWDPMDEDWGPSNDFLAWHKWKLGWLAPTEVHCLARPGTRTITLTPTSRPGGTKLAVVPLSPTRALTLEARTPGPLDHAVCRPGVLITTVATDRPTGTGPVRTEDATPDSPGCYTTDPNVNAPLSDAPYTTGQTFTTQGATVRVLGPTPSGDWRVALTRHAPRPTAALPAAPSHPLH